MLAFMPPLASILKDLISDTSKFFVPAFWSSIDVGGASKTDDDVMTAVRRCNDVTLFPLNTTS
jgi:hypothetical protein